MDSRVCQKIFESKTRIFNNLNVMKSPLTSISSRVDCSAANRTCEMGGVGDFGNGSRRMVFFGEEIWITGLSVEDSSKQLKRNTEMNTRLRNVSLSLVSHLKCRKNFQVRPRILAPHPCFLLQITSKDNQSGILLTAVEKTRRRVGVRKAGCEAGTEQGKAPRIYGASILFFCFRWDIEDFA